jgi:hypothetical protein
MRAASLSRDRQHFLLAALLYVLLTALLTYPISVHPASVSLGNDIDVQLYTWTLAWNTHALVHDPLRIFDANIFYPYSNTLALSENLIGSSIVAGPVLWLTHDPVVAMNAVSLASCVLCAVGAYVLARRVGLTSGAAFLCGLIFAFSPARFFRFQQMHLTTVQWIPFSLAFLYSYLQSGRRADLRWSIAFFTLQAITSGHGAVFLAIAAAVLVGVELTVRARSMRHVEALVAGATRLARDVGFTGLLLLVPAALLVYPYLAVQRELGLRRTLGSWRFAPESLLASPTHVHSWILAHATSVPINDRAIAFLFPGYVPLVLAVIALVPIGRHYVKATVSFALVVAIALWFCVGPPWSVWPLVYWLPGFNFIRVPSRLAILGVLGLAVLAAIAFDRLGARFWPQNRIAAAIIATVLVVGECAAVPLPVSPYTVTYGDVDRWLDSQPKPFAIAEVPVGLSLRYQSTYMLHSMAHWQKTVHGYSGLTPALHERLYGLLRSFPDHESVDALRSLRVQYVVVHTNGYEPAEWTAFETRMASVGSALRLVHAEQDGRVYAVQ